MTTGENLTNWGDVTNTNLGTALEEAIAGSADVAFSSADVTLTLTNTNATQTARNMRLNLTGTSGGARVLNVPLVEKMYVVNNGLADACTVKVSGQTGVSVPAGKTMLLFNNGTDIVDAITHLSSLTLATDLAVADGGTGASSASAARTNLGVAIGTDVQAWDANLDQIAALAVTDGNFVVGNGSAWVAESGATARTSLGLGTLATLNTINNDNWSGTDLSVANGGTGASSLTANNVLLGNGTSAVQVVAPGTSGNVLTSNGSTWTSAAAAVSSFGVTAASDTFGNDTTVSVPSNTLFVVGNFYVSWGGSSGARCSVQLKSSGGTILQEFYIGGGNENNGNDGGSGMSNRTQFMFALPSTCTSIRFYRSSGSSTISGNVDQWVTYS